MALTSPATLGPATMAPLASERRWFEEQGVNFGIALGPDVVQRPIPFDPIPRQIPKQEWAVLERGLLPRVAALDDFIRDTFDDQRILRAGRIPAAVVYAPRGAGFSAEIAARTIRTAPARTSRSAVTLPTSSIQPTGAPSRSDLPQRVGHRSRRH